MVFRTTSPTQRLQHLNITTMRFLCLHGTGTNSQVCFVRDLLLSLHSRLLYHDIILLAQVCLLQGPMAWERRRKPIKVQYTDI